MLCNRLSAKHYIRWWTVGKIMQIFHLIRTDLIIRSEVCGFRKLVSVEHNGESHLPHTLLKYFYAVLAYKYFTSEVRFGLQCCLIRQLYYVNTK